MGRKPVELNITPRDGSSQADRRLDALDPSYALIDERTTEDLLAFARWYGQELAWFDLDNKPRGNWSAFLGPGLTLSEVAAFLRQPERFTPAESPGLYRPHLVLFLTYLKLLEHARGELNTFTRRHLDFYYRQVLRMERKAAVPDRVNLLVDLAAGEGQALVAAGSLVTAGQDSRGEDRFYAIDRDLVVNRAQIGRLSSVYTERRVIGFAEARVIHRNDRKRSMMAAFELALGEPAPGDRLPPYPGAAGKVPDAEFIAGIGRMLRLASDPLFLKFFELRQLVELKRRRDTADAEWNEINEVLEKAGRTRDASFRLNAAEPRNFQRNFEAAAGGAPDYAGLPEVRSADDLYSHRIREDVQRFIREKLFLTDVNDFVRMMQIKVRIDNEWREINRLLEQAGRRKNAAFRMPAEGSPGFDATDFAANFRAALNAALPGNMPIEAYYAQVTVAEGYFHLTAEEISYVLWVMERTEPGAGHAEWSKTDEILAKAHREKVWAGRRRKLADVFRASGFSPMIRYALGEVPGAGEEPAALERLAPLIKSGQDLELLRKAQGGPVTPAERDRVFGIVEVAQRIREGFTAPDPRRIDWLNLHPAEDAATAAVNQPGAGIRWRTFGQAPASANAGAPPPEMLGCAISSPLLGMQEGRREIRLTLRVTAEPFKADEIRKLLDTKEPFVFEVSTGEGWARPRQTSARVAAYRRLAGPASLQPDGDAIQFTLTFGEDADPFLPPGPAEKRVRSSWPVLLILLRQIWNAETGKYEALYPELRPLVVSAAHLAVKVEGLRSLNLANDDTTIDPGKPFEPFGDSPAAGSRLLVAHEEICAKRLDSLWFRIDWMGLPANLGEHYQNYEIGSNPPFNMGVSLVDQRLKLPLSAGAALFTAGKAGHAIEIANVPALLPDGFSYETLSGLTYPDDLAAWRRYLIWELNEPAFQHQNYSRVAAAKSLELAAAIANRTGTATIDPKKYQVNPPYTPKIRSLSIDYTASAEVNLDTPERPRQPVRIFHIHPFGHCGVESAWAAGGPPLVPRYDDAGELYIGLKDLRAPQTVAILFQMAEGSADPDLAPEPVQWSALSADRWIPLEQSLVSDSTRGLLSSGVIEFALNEVQPSTRIHGDEGLYWLRAAVKRNTASVCDAIAFHTQAVSATLVDRGIAPDHFLQPLPAGTITGFEQAPPEVSGVRQPYTSIGGRAAEEDSLFATRVSERLRHKNRALTAWDYERLVLDRFPEIYKAKCIPASVARNPADPGRVDVVVIPDIRHKLPFNPFEPKAPANLLTEIHEHLAARMPASASLRVSNPYYVTVKVRFAVRFKPSGNEGYYRQLLNDELNRFLSPWAYLEGADIVIGGRIYANSIVDFLDRRPYVDYIADLKLFSSEDGETFRFVRPDPERGYSVSAGRPDGVLVAAREHQIDYIPAEGFEEELLTGINFMKLELDFVVA